jgi:suppressor of ftsI
MNIASLVEDSARYTPCTRFAPPLQPGPRYNTGIGQPNHTDRIALTMPNRAAAFRHSRLTRRQLAGASLGVMGAAAIGGGLAASLGPTGRIVRAEEAAAGPGPNPWQEPPVILSENGVLQATLDARPVAGATHGLMAYNGTIPGPTLRVRPGDTMKVRLQNNLGGDMSNLHVHGMHVSPEGNSDNIFVMLQNGESFDYEYVLPENHPAGVYWYHPHHHGDAQQQVGGGLAGLIIVDGGVDELPGIRETPERVFAIQALQQSTGAASCMVNGVVNPLVAMRPGQTQHWYIANVSANAYIDLALDGHQMTVIGLDGNPLTKAIAADSWLLAPAERIQVLVQATETGTFALKSRAWGELGQAQPEMTVATVEVAGASMVPQPLPVALLDLPDFADVDIAQQRIVTFQENVGDLPFAIDGVAFDANVVNTTVKLGAIEEWVLRNTSGDWHPFHIHVNDFQVMNVNGTPVSYVNRKDTVSIPAHGSVTIRIDFADFAGKFVYHCHILSHEDFGMMSIIEVVP